MNTITNLQETFKDIEEKGIETSIVQNSLNKALQELSNQLNLEQVDRQHLSDILSVINRTLLNPKTFNNPEIVKPSCELIVRIAGSSTLRPKLWEDPHNTVLQGLVSTLESQECGDIAKDTFFKIAHNMREGEFDFLRDNLASQDEEKHKYFFKIISTTCILYQVNLHPLLEPFKSNPLKNEFQGQKDLDIIHKLNIGLINYEDMAKMTDEQIYFLLPLIINFFNLYLLGIDRAINLVRTHKREQKEKQTQDNMEDSNFTFTVTDLLRKPAKLFDLTSLTSLAGSKNNESFTALEMKDMKDNVIEPEEEVSLENVSYRVKYYIKQMPSVFLLLLHRVYNHPKLSQLLSWLEETDRGFANVSHEKVPAIKSKIVYISSTRQKTFEFFELLVNSLATAKAGTLFNDLTILCPTHEAIQNTLITQVEIKKVFPSRAQPLLLDLMFTPDSKIKNQQIIFKIGGAMADMYTSLMMRIFNALWKMQPMDIDHIPFLETYTVLPVGRFSEKKEEYSCIECVGSLVSLEDFDWPLLEKLDNDRLKYFCRSAVGAYVFGHVMALRDRHKDNMMIKLDEQGLPSSFLQIDFEFVLCDEVLMSPPLAIQPEFENIMRKRGYWNRFVNQFIDAFMTLHRNFGLLKNFTSLLYANVPIGIVEVLSQTKNLVHSENYIPDLLCKTLLVQNTDDQIYSILRQKLESASSSLAQTINNKFHTGMVSVINKIQQPFHREQKTEEKEVTPEEAAEVTLFF